MDTDEWWQRLDEEWGSSVSKADEECASVGCMVCAAVKEENFRPCRGGWEEAWARSVWVVVGRRLKDGWCGG